jgi:hypothetical protein
MLTERSILAVLPANELLDERFLAACTHSVGLIFSDSSRGGEGRNMSLNARDAGKDQIEMTASCGCHSRLGTAQAAMVLFVSPKSMQTFHAGMCRVLGSTPKLLLCTVNREMDLQGDPGAHRIMLKQSGSFSVLGCALIGCKYGSRNLWILSESSCPCCVFHMRTSGSVFCCYFQCCRLVIPRVAEKE